MGYESLSTVVVLAIVIILMAFWLPKRTVKGMKRVIEHREDRFSPSLHLVDADSGTRFSDETAAKAKGAIMQSNETHEGKLTNERIAHVRALRRAAIRRRRIIVVSMLVITIVVLMCAFVLHFSPLFALIPASLLAGVLALGVRAAKQAAAWEHKVAKYRSKMRKRAAAERKRAQEEQAERARLREQELAEIRRIAESQVPTDVMPEGEIRQAIDRGKADRDAVVSKRKEESEAKSEAKSAAEPNVVDAQVMPDKKNGLSIHDERDEIAKTEGVDACDADSSAVAGASQDLISFSLGAPRNGDDIVQDAPESMEIKSTRQVAKAVPPTASTVSDNVEPLIVPTDAISSMDSDEAAARVEAGVHLQDVDAVGFHDSEVSADVEAPSVTSDSLGVGLASIMARRGA
ncbi:hypothetical protein [Bifidobacterium pseudocatenulatum]|uniref:hypothetical protein n=1 Tax=Bifidobacterium pseudocatenulatum TaxID=28026 RepID=UPI000E437DA8|nr:hypothetical protein [Bifidobacterium pseudocatenulatum]RGI74285.1 hypothetical protein DXD87_04490 [Bifidobacterium pseudocatenulatum]